MAQRVETVMVDDLDGTEGDSVLTVTFTLDGVDYEIDLSADNRHSLMAAMEPFIGAARRVGGRRKYRRLGTNGDASGA